MVSRRTGHGRIHGRDQTERMHFPYASGRGDAIRRSDRVDKGNTDSDENTWGYMPIHIETVGDFIRVSRPEISTEDFVGNAHEIEYVVRAEKLHGGRNYGALKFVTPYETLTYEVEVLQNQEYDEDHRMPELLLAQIIKEYVGYVAGRVTLEHCG